MPRSAFFCANCGQAVGRPLQPQELTNELVNLVNNRYVQEHWLHRLLAFIIDAVLVGIAVFVLEIIFLSAYVGLNFLGFTFVFVPTLAGFVGSIILVLYFSTAETMYGKTIGKSIFHLRVVVMDGSRLDFGEALIRNVSKIYWLLLLLDILLGLVSSTQRGQKFSDYIVHTNVVRTAD